MNKRILISLSVIGAVAAIAIGGTVAYFSDVETSTGNTLTAGTINLTVNGEDPLRSALVELEDMKPSTWFAVQTPVVVTDNPADLYKHYGQPECDTGTETEPECTDQGGEWVDGVCAWNGNDDYNDLYKHTTIDLAICWDWDGDGKIFKVDADNDGTPDVPPSECVVIFDSRNHVKLGSVISQWIPLKGNVEPGREYIVHQSFHLQGEVTNWAQGDVCTFSEDFLAQQVGTSPVAP